VAESVEDEPITSWINPTMKRLSGSISESRFSKIDMGNSNYSYRRCSSAQFATS
jgi:hypothetical protein